MQLVTDLPSVDARRPESRPPWTSLPRRAMGFRFAHIVWGVAQLGALTYVWACALLRRRGNYLWASVALLMVQGAALALGRGDCPLDPFQRRLGDPVPMFELFLRPRAAKVAIPVLFAVAVAAIVAALIRPPSGPSSPS